VQLAVYTAVAVAALRTWRRTPEESSRWLAATFGVLASVLLVGGLLPEHSDKTVVLWLRKVLVAGLLLFPYCLYRFAVSFTGPRRNRHRIAIVLTAVVVILAAAVPYIPEEGDPEPWWLLPFAATVAVQWTAISFLAAQRLWTAGAGQAAVARRRMRLMAAGAAVLDLGLVVAVAASSASDALALALQVLGVVAAGLFFLGFAPPRFLRVVWRQQDVAPLRAAEVDLMATVTAADVADALLPAVTRMLAGKGSVLADRAGTVVAAHNLSAEEAQAFAASAVAADDGVPPARRDLMAVSLRHGWLAVQSSPYTPVFGREEMELLEQLAVFADLALDRAALFEQERASRERAERANAEVETFVYSVSHDLKSPLVSLVGFLGFLRSDLGAAAQGDVAFYLDRMDAGVRYMEALIHDLLELSRIGRVQTEPSDVDLARMVREIADELAPNHPEATVHVGELPVLHVNPLRARELFTNLVGNALTHAGRSDVTVRVASEPLPDGGVRMIVADDGKGIPAAGREKVFGVFERLERATDDSGTGIGLAVCRKIVEQLDGDIRVVEARKGGATFEIVLPRAVVASRTASLAGAR
jgi:signal transduction histidine kinase